MSGVQERSAILAQGDRRLDDCSASSVITSVARHSLDYSHRMNSVLCLRSPALTAEPGEQALTKSLLSVLRAGPRQTDRQRIRQGGSGWRPPPALRRTLPRRYPQDPPSRLPSPAGRAGGEDEQDPTAGVQEGR
jgi:hypothetical protein